ncbi:hypothetical protein MMC32_004929 [Xylographa parallela]|nr:hypothetical protein [Xylographa parallela]
MLVEHTLFFALLAYRYLRLIVNVVAFLLLRPIAVPENPLLTSNDVTVVVPSLALDQDRDEFKETVHGILATNPFEVILVTIDENVERVKLMVKSMATTKVRVLSVSQPNKRRQMVRAIPEVRTSITIFADDDVRWPKTILPWMLAPLEDAVYGGVGTNQRLRRAVEPSLSQRVWGFLGAMYLLRRNFDCAACSYMDGGLPCLSGRTVAYRTKILSDTAFTDGFTHEEWNSEYQLNADDDNFITRWLVSHGHRIAFQYHREAEVETTLEDNPKFLKQCLRWSRSNWRSNITSMFIERHIWRLARGAHTMSEPGKLTKNRQQPWSTYAVHLTTLTHWALLWDVGLLYYCPKESWVFWPVVALIATSKWIKFVGHFLRHPVDVLLLPVLVVFGYLHGLIKLYAACTLHVTAWGTREGADANDAYRMIHLTQTGHEHVLETKSSQFMSPWPLFQEQSQYGKHEPIYPNSRPAQVPRDHPGKPETICLILPGDE